VAQDTKEEETPSIEIPAGYLHWRSNPDASVKRGFKEITKDMVLANLSEEDLKIIRECEDLYGQNESLIKDKIINRDDVNQAQKFLERMMNSICASSVGFKGYGRSLDTTVIQLKEVKEEDLRKGGRFWGRRKE